MINNQCLDIHDLLHYYKTLLMSASLVPKGVLLYLSTQVLKSCGPSEDASEISFYFFYP